MLPPPLYLRHAIKDELANQGIEGLSQSTDQYEETIGCLKRRCDLLHPKRQAHICAIVDVSSVKEGNGKDLCCLYDVLNQYLRTLAAMKQKKTASFYNINAVAETRPSHDV